MLETEADDLNGKSSSTTEADERKWELLFGMGAIEIVTCVNPNGEDVALVQRISTEEVEEGRESVQEQTNDK